MPSNIGFCKPHCPRSNSVACSLLHRRTLITLWSLLMIVLFFGNRQMAKWTYFVASLVFWSAEADFRIPHGSSAIVGHFHRGNSCSKCVKQKVTIGSAEQMLSESDSSDGLKMALWVCWQLSKSVWKFLRKLQFWKRPGCHVVRRCRKLWYRRHVLFHLHFELSLICLRDRVKQFRLSIRTLTPTSACYLCDLSYILGCRDIRQKPWLRGI